jgi:chloramphenicol O-acetyltransferase type A
MKRIIDLSQWNRREHFEYFKQYDEPYHGVMVQLDCTASYRSCKRDGNSFFLTYLHHILRAVNETDAMRYRLESNAAVVYTTIHCGPTIARADHTFGFCLIEYAPDFEAYSARARTAIERVRATPGLCLSETSGRNDLIYFSTLPGIAFTGLTNARRYGDSAGVPLITVGKCVTQGERMLMPLAVYVHHALVDGHDVHVFLQRLEQLLAESGVRDNPV